MSDDSQQGSLSDDSLGGESALGVGLGNAIRRRANATAPTPDLNSFLRRVTRRVKVRRRVRVGVAAAMVVAVIGGGLAAWDTSRDTHETVSVTAGDSDLTTPSPNAEPRESSIPADSPQSGTGDPLQSPTPNTGPILKWIEVDPGFDLGTGWQDVETQFSGEYFAVQPLADGRVIGGKHRFDGPRIN